MKTVTQKIVTTFAFGSLCASASAVTLAQIDYGLDSDAAAEVQTGWTGELHSGAQGPDSTRATVLGNGITLTIAATGGGQLQARGAGSGRSAITGTSWDQVARDFFVTRSGDGGLTITLEGLSIGTAYTLLGIHNDGDGNTGFGTGFFHTPAVNTGATLNSPVVAGEALGIDGAAVDGDFSNSLVAFTATDTTVVLDYTSDESNGFFVLSGLQLDSVPEPSSSALLGLAGLALTLRRRR